MSQGPPRRREPGESAVAEFEKTYGELGEERAQMIAALGAHAAALFQQVLGNADLLAYAEERPLELDDSPSTLSDLFQLDAMDEEDLKRELRQRRTQALVRIALRELLGLADIDQTSREMSFLADAATEAALTAARRTQAELVGEPVTEDGSPVSFVVIGMGKLGGKELNLGSDVDLCFFYETDQATFRDAPKDADPPSVHEFFSKVAARLSNALSEVTEHGFVFRVDLRLRPEGSRGPLVNSVANAERYYENWGRTWERAALLRARPVAGDLVFGESLLRQLKPFVFKKQVDPSLALAMREMVEQSRRQLSREPERDVKLGRGGIREAEFFVQALQLIWGGKQIELQVRGTVLAIRRLVSLGHLSEGEGAQLESDWALLRRVEHRIQVQSGLQTHTVFADSTRREALAESLGFTSFEAFDDAVSLARERVAQLFDSLGADRPEMDRELESLLDAVATWDSEARIGRLALSALGATDVDAAVAYLSRLSKNPTSPLSSVARAATPALGRLLLSEAARSTYPDGALRFIVDLFTRIERSPGIQRWLVDHPRKTRRLVGLFGSSVTLSSLLLSRPEALDRILTQPEEPTAETVRRSHRNLERELTSGRLQDPDFVEGLRRLKTEHTLEAGLFWASGDVPFHKIEELLTQLAECQIALALRFAGRSIVGAQEAEVLPDLLSRLVVVALGKVGTGETGFGSDLDLIFLFDPTPEGPAIDAFTKIAQRTLRTLSQPSAAGPGYRTDTRLRPSGSKGLLVVSLDAFRKYHDRTAKAWERQALLRARPVSGDDERKAKVREIIERAISRAPPDAASFAEMRRRLEDELAGEGTDRYHAKYGFGALIEVEFLVQWLQMHHSDSLGPRSTRQVLTDLGNQNVLSDERREVLEAARAFFRAAEQALKLLDENAEALVIFGGGRWHHLARALDVRDRDGRSQINALRAEWLHHACAVRSLFEELVAKVGTKAPWGVGDIEGGAGE